jgi:hypothetical protein
MKINIPKLPGSKDYKAPAPKSGAIKGVEIFRTGKWNGDSYSVKDLQDIVDSAAGVGFNPPVKLGHAEKSGGMAFGWVENVRITFDNAKKSAARLVADFIDVPEEIVTLVKERRFDAVSSEIFWNFKRNGKTFRRVLKAVALLGAETPGVGNLKPLHEVVEFSDETWEGLHAYTVQPQIRRAPMTLKTLADCTARLAALKTEIAEEQDAEKRTALYAEQSEVADKLVELSANPPESNDDDDGNKKDALDFKAMQDEMAEMKAELAQSREDTRAANVEVKVNNLRVPALRDHVAALYDLASRSAGTSVRFFTGEDDKGVRKYGEVDATKVVDDLVDRINKSTEKLFTTLGTSGDFKRDDEPATDNSIDAGAELDRLTKVFMVKNDLKDSQYSQAFSAVLDDPDNATLKTLYAEAG